MSSSNRNNNGGPPDIGSWIATIIMLFVFWPVGIFMLIGRLREAAKYSGDNVMGRKIQQRPETRQSPGQRSAAGQSAQYAAPPAVQRPVRTAEDAPVKNGASKGDEKSISARAFARLKKEQASTKSISAVILIAAIIGLVAGGVGLISAFADIATAGLYFVLNELLVGSFFAIGGAALLVVRSLIPKRVKLRRRYLALIGERETMKISDFTAAFARSQEKVENDLQEMIDDGYFGSSAYIDEGLGMLILNSDSADTLRTEQAKPAEHSDESTISEYDRILRELRSVNNRITDATITYKVDRIESTCSKIFSTVEENPEKLPQIRRFMSYYLPTTLKLLRSYATLEKQGIQGENIASTKESINNVLSKLVTGFDEQLDQLFRVDAMDISSDIEVLQNMMAQDGLTESGPMMQTSTGESTPGYFEIR